MNSFDILPTPAYMEVLSPEKLRTLSLRRTQNLDDIMARDEQARHAPALTSNAFRREGYVLRTSEKGVVIYAESAAGYFYGENLVGKLVRTSKDHIPHVLVIDYPAFPIRGTIEGFYGMPWTWEQRRDLVEAIAQAGFNTFIFMPADVNLKVNWRMPLPDSYKERLEQLIHHAHNNHIKFIYEILPICIDLGSQQDYRSLLARCKEVIALGVDGIVIAFDDTNDYEGKHVQREKAAVGQARLLNDLLQQIGNELVILGLAPVEYHGTKPTPYLKTLGRELDTAVYVGWTGPKIISPVITREDAIRYGEVIRRKPFLAHNFPVIDEPDKKRRITIGPLTGLDPNLLHFVEGVAFNFMPLPYTSLVPGFTAGDFAWNPECYNPLESIVNSTKIHGPNLMRFVEINPESYINPNGAPDIVKVLRYKRLKDLKQGEILELRRMFNTMVSLDDLMTDGVNPRIHNEIRPWLVQGNITGALGNSILNGNRLSAMTKAFGAYKMVTGYRLGGSVIENWILRELGSPSSLLYHLPFLRLWVDYFERISDLFEKVSPKRHQRQKI